MLIITANPLHPPIICNLCALHVLLKTRSLYIPISPRLNAVHNVKSNPLLFESTGEHLGSEFKYHASLDKWQRLILLRCLIYQYAGVSELLTGLLTYRFSLNAPFFEALCITRRASLLKRLLLVLLKLLTLLLQLSTCNVEILPLVIKALIRLINLPTLNSQILLLLSKGALLIHHRAVHFLRCGLIVTQRINIGFNLPSPFEHELLKVCMIPTELSLPAYLPSLIITYIAMLAIGSGELATQLPRVLRIRRKRISKHMNVRSRF